MELRQYDFIFLGSGCASLSVIMRMIHSGAFREKKILLIDKQPKNRNDRTWCYWEEGTGFFEDIVFKRWNKLNFRVTTEELIELDTGNFSYKMIRGIEFYEKCFASIASSGNIDLLYGEISLEIQEDPSGATLLFNGEPLELQNKPIVFNSIDFPRPAPKGAFYMLQHFKGWTIQTSQPAFDPAVATLMDFSVPQLHGTTFAYLLPFTSTRALVEYTVFSKQLLGAEQYDLELRNYLQQRLNGNPYQVLEQEFGVIPMTNQSFPVLENEIHYIGTAGGQTKPSTGYTFQFIQHQAERIVKALTRGSLPAMEPSGGKSRFHFYDSTLLHILSGEKMEGKHIFSELFRRNPAHRIFRFLDNQTRFPEEIRLLNTLPKWVFLKAGMKEGWKMIINRKKS